MLGVIARFTLCHLTIVECEVFIIIGCDVYVCRGCQIRAEGNRSTIGTLSTPETQPTNTKCFVEYAAEM